MLVPAIATMRDVEDVLATYPGSQTFHGIEVQEWEAGRGGLTSWVGFAIAARYDRYRLGIGRARSWALALMHRP